MDEFDFNTESPMIPDINAQAMVNLIAARDRNPEAELAAVKESEKTGTPVEVLNALDNGEMKKPDVSSLHPATMRVLADPTAATVFRDKVTEVNDAVEIGQYAREGHLRRMEALKRRIREKGYTEEELASLKAAGWTPAAPDGTASRHLNHGKFKNGAGWVSQWPVLDEWVCGPGERKALEKMRESGKITPGGGPSFYKDIPDDAGAAWLMLHPGRAEALIKRRSMDIAAMKALYSVYGDLWHTFSDAALRHAIDTAGTAFKTDFSMVSPARLRPVGLGRETRWAEAVNFFGVQDVLERRTALSGKELYKVYRNPGSYDLADQMAVVDKLDEQARALRTSTGWNTAANVTLSSIRFAAELGTTANASGTLAALERGSVAGFFKSIPRFLASLGKQEIKRLPAYAVPKAAETFNELQSTITPVIEKGAVLPGLTGDQTSEYANAYFNKMLDTFIENYSEGLGGLISVPVMKAVSKAVPQTIKNAAFVKIAENVLGNVKLSKGAKLASMVYERSMFNGLLGEYTEEKWGDAIRAAVTSVARSLGTKYGDLGQESVFGSAEQELSVMGGLLLTGALFSSVRLPSAYGDIYRAGKFIDTQRAVNAAVQKIGPPSPDGNPVVERMIRDFSGRSDLGFLPAQNARTLFQSNPEVMESLGITEDVIAEAENTGRFVTVSMASVHTRVKPEQANELILNMVPDPEGTLTAAEAEKLDLSAEAQEKFKAQEAEQQEIQAAYNEAVAQLRQLGRSDSEIRAAAKFLSMAKYFADHSNMSAADWIRNVAFQKLKESDWREQMEQDISDVPAGAVRFAPRLFQISPVWTGSAADYDQPDTDFVGTGEGAQVYGWGLYGSSSRGVGEGYAEADVANKRNPDVLWDGKPSDVFFREMRNDKGGTTDGYWHLSGLHDMLKAKKGDIDSVKQIIQEYIELKEKFNQPKEDIEGLRRRLQLLEEFKDRINYWPGLPQESFTINGVKYIPGEGSMPKDEWLQSVITYLHNYGGDRKAAIRAAEYNIKHYRESSEKDALRDLLERTEKVLSFLSDQSNAISYEGGTTGRRNLYKQTFWPNMQENLLDWDEDITQEQADLILDGLSNPPADVWKRVVDFINSERDVDNDWLVDEDTGEVYKDEDYADDVARDYLERYMDFYEASGQYVYRQLCDLLGSAKAASEFLYSVGIHGITYIGDSSGVRNYVAFSGKDIRIDRHIMFQPLRKPGDPNNAEGHGLLRDGHVPYGSGFMEWAGLNGKGLYADYEFLYSRHWRNFGDQEHARAAVELVLSKPEQVEDMADGKNSSFVGFDEVTGAIYRIEIEKEVKNKRNHVRSVFEITPAQYEEIKLDPPRVLQPSQNSIQDGGEQARTISSFLRYDTPSSEKVKPGSEKSPKTPASDLSDLSDKSVKNQSTASIHRGATTFNGEWNAMITLFEGAADASTLVHEIGHYTFETMRKLVERGLADERMTEDWNKLLKFIGAKPGEALTVEQSEKLARAFEAYCLEGRAPSVELEGAFATLRYLLLQVYKSVRALGVKLNDEVRAVFDGMLATDDAADGASVINEAAREINAELLGLSQAEVKTYRELIEKANRQAVQEITERKDKELSELRPQWRKEASDRMANDPVYKAWNEALTAPLDFTDVVNLTDENTALLLRSRGLTSAPGRKSEAKIDEKTGDLLKAPGHYSSKPGVHPAETAMKFGFDSAETMLRDLASALTPHDFIGSYMAEREAAFHAQFKASEAAMSAQASIDALEKLSELLAVKGGMEGYRMRREMFKRRALDEINSMTVSDVVSDSAIIGACRREAKELTAAVNKSDFKTAFDLSQKLRFNLEVLRHKAAARKAVTQTERLLSRARHAKKGVIYGDHQDALLDLSVRFGFTRPGKEYAHTVAEVIQDYNEQAEECGYAPLEVPQWLLNGNIRYGSLPFGEFTMLSELAQFLDGEGRSLVKGRRAAFNAAVTESIEGCVGVLEKQKHRYTRDSMFHAPRVLINWGTKLRNILGMAAGWEKDSPLQKLYDEMVDAAADETHLMAEPAAVARQALDALHKSKFNLASIADIPFPADVQAWGYRKWDAQKVIAACLNMGTAKNRQRLIDGYEWGDRGDSYCARIASLLSEEDWANIQKLWDAVGRSGLTERVRQTFKEEKHFDLKLEEAVPFDVITSDGKSLTVEGGYYPLDYLFHKNSFVQAEADASAYRAPAFRRASFTFERTEKLADPLSLDLNLIHTHIFDTAHYVSHRRIMAKVLRVINDYHFKSHFQQTQGFERYQALKELCTNVAAPGAFLKGMTSGLENWGRTALTAGALWFNPSVVLMQLSSFTYGIDELGSAWTEAVGQFLLHPVNTRDFVLTRSGLMRDRVNLKDIDLRTPLNRFTETAPEHFRRLVMEFGYAPMRFVDLAVAVPAWMAAYNKAVGSGMDEIKAVAQADEFVARTQGSTRALDLSPLQLKAWGRSLTVFFSAVSAGATMGTRTLNRLVNGSMTKYEAAFAAAANILAPWLLAGAIRMIAAGPGGDDPERPWRSLIRELISNPFGGVPVLRDAADFVAGGIARKATGKKFLGTQRTVIENTSFRAISDLIVTAVEGADAAIDENPERALYKFADAAGTLFRVPVIGVYERARRMLGSWTGDPDRLPDFEKRTRKNKNQIRW